MRIVFMGTPAFARDILDALLAMPVHEVIAVYCQPPRPGGRRGAQAVPCPVQMRAEGCGIRVFTPRTLRDAAAQAEFAALGADIAVVAAYGLILPPAVLDAPRLGCLNVHASLLPRWRGAAPIQRAILAGDAETGVDIMRMEAGLDTGPVLAEARTAVAGKTAGELTDELAALGARLLVEVLGDPAAFPARAQPEDGVTYAAKVTKEEWRLDFSRSAEDVARQVRAFNPPGAWFAVDGERVRVLAAEIVRHPSESWDLAPDSERDAARDPSFRWGDEFKADDVSPTAPLPASPLARPPSPRWGEGKVVDDRLTIACGVGAIRPVSVQRAGRGVMTAEELLRGFPIPAGTRL